MKSFPARSCSSPSFVMMGAIFLLLQFSFPPFQGPLYLVDATTAKAKENDQECSKEEPTPESCPSTTTTAIKQDNLRSPIPETCQLVWAPKPSNNENNIKEWGVFSMTDRVRGTPVLPGDVVLQLVDPSSPLPPQQQQSHPLDSVMAWPGQETGGQYEGRNVVQSLVPGLGMMVAHIEQQQGQNSELPSNSVTSKSNILPFVPRVDEGGLTRQEHPGAGAITHYHNYTWYVQRPIQAGEELFRATPYISNEDIGSMEPPSTAATTTATTKNILSLEYLQNNGYCIDNIMPTNRRGSKLKQAGRGAVAVRDLSEGSIVAPVPVIAIPESILQVKDPLGGNGINPKQLLLNYCYRPFDKEVMTNTTTETTSSPSLSSPDIWLFPYAPHVNLINHYPTPNVRIQWSSETLDELLPLQDIGDENATPSSQILMDALEKYIKMTTEDPSSRPPLILELVALRDIQAGEELFMDYGPAWEKAWYEHVTAKWRPIPDEVGHYAPASVVDDTIRLLRTEQEQKNHPYPTNVETSCFYRYQDHAELVEVEEVERQTRALMNPKQASGAAPALTTYKWNMTKGIYDMKHLRPCTVLRRSNNDEQGRKTLYAVRIYNRPGLHPTEVLPTAATLPSKKKKKKTSTVQQETTPIMHIVTHVPRSAIRLTDRPYTTDTHLPGAFRHEIGIPMMTTEVTSNAAAATRTTTKAITNEKDEEEGHNQ